MKEESTPRELGPYRLDRLLGRGGMGEVYLATDARLDRQVAIKHVRVAGESGVSETARARFRREAWAAARIAHPSVVPVFDIVEDETGDWIVMEYVEGPTLRDLTADEPLDAVEACRYGAQVAEGLAAAHARGIVHRDLKAENVLVAPSGHAKILDFGLAKRLELGDDEGSLTARGEVMGTVRAMSPEQARGLDVDARSDLFSLGILLYEITTGQSPFAGQTALDTLSRVVSHEPPPPIELRPELPAELSRLVERLLEKGPERRPQTASEVAAALGGLAVSGAQPSVAGSQPGGAWEAETVVGSDELPGDAEVGSGAGSGDPAREETASLDDESRPGPAIGGASARGSKGLVRGLVAALSIVALALLLSLLWPRDASESATVTEEAAETAASTPESSYEILQRARRDLRAYDDRARLESALEALTQLVADEPESAPAHAALADAYLRRYLMAKDAAWLTKAHGIASKAVELDPYLSSAHVALGAALHKEGRLEEARSHFEQALQLDPSNARARLERADLAVSMGELESAVETLEAVVADGQATAEHFDLLGSIHLRLGRYEEAATAFRRGIELAPDRVLPRRNLAAALYAQGRLAEAAAQIQSALEIRPSPSLYSNLGTLLYAQGLYTQAADSYERALAEGGGHIAQIWMNVGDAYRRIPGREQQAEQAFTRTVQLLEDKASGEARDVPRRSRLALALAKLDRVGASRRQVEALRSLPELDPPSLYRLAVASEINGDRRLALALLEQALVASFPVDEVAADPELEALRLDPTYHRLLTRFESPSKSRSDQPSSRP